jgi:hypothetical protein
MTFQRALSPEKELMLVAEYEDGWNINELSIIYRVSERTVYRVLGRHNVPKKFNKRLRYAKPKPKKEPKLYPCGTNAAYQRHRRKGEYPCSACLEAHSLNVKQHKNRGSLI